MLRDALYAIFEGLVANVPGGLGRRLRRAYYRLRLAGMGPGVVIDCGVRIVGPEWVQLGANCWIDHNVLILAGPARRDRGAFLRKGEAPGLAEGEVRIGANCHIAPFVVLQGHGGIGIGAGTTVASGGKVYSLSHHYRNPADPADGRRFKFSSMVPPGEQALISAPVTIGESAAVGLNAVLLPGTTVGPGAWIGAGSVVRGTVPADTLFSAPAPDLQRPIARNAPAADAPLGEGPGP